MEPDCILDLKITIKFAEAIIVINTHRSTITSKMASQLSGEKQVGDMGIKSG